MYKTFSRRTEDLIKRQGTSRPWCRVRRKQGVFVTSRSQFDV